ncbi:VOC family protein [Ureibacillus endophyticus]|uniref:VOC family protein n=1 Tax=Ureibacillus endophyticus TaxID=1978490 RepID=A0A494YUG0_9BACL|nr:VOC family protein [Lysinibacillus endophyticus]RKQ13700.1 VOC family protein [Lysinibacillus endophyticus]
MRSASPYVFVDNCIEVIEFYRNLFGGEIRNIQQDDDGKCLYAELSFGSSSIHFSDTYGQTQKGDNVRISLECESEKEIRRVYQSLIVDGSITFELQQTSWGALHANVVDQFGVGWLLNLQQS